jgi:serine/threonine protein kinase
MPANEADADLPADAAHAAPVLETSPARSLAPVSASLIELPPPPVQPQKIVAKPKKAPGNPASHRDDIVIPDYTLLKRIGSGAYGEVWLGQSVTGALRAVKIVWREDFEHTRTFQREFLGIQQFEPISRGHPCLVHILHVGWNEKRGFYYCVMELGDDVEEGGNITNIDSYVPRTLGTDMKRHGRLDPFFCRDAGVYMADALHYMHNHGLTHRDIKPSNVIFVGGVCKLADIGLVAAFGERSFVGTEGFVPPEGPGTPQADLYSLGKVLYEMSSGKDRMEFPEVPDEISDEEWPFWLDLNRVICQACENDLDRRFATAADFAEALQRVGEKRPETFSRRFCRAAIYTVIGSFVLASGLVMARHQRDWHYEVAAPMKPKPVAPEPPLPGRPWQNRLKQWFSFKEGKHIADLPTDIAHFRSFVDTTLRAAEYSVLLVPQPDKSILNAAVVSAVEADAYCAWMTEIERRNGRLDLNHEYSWKPAKLTPSAGSPPPKNGMQAIVCEIIQVRYGAVTITSTPPGADVYDGQEFLGRTPVRLPHVRAAKFNFSVNLPGYKIEHASGDLKQGQTIAFNLRLKASGAVVFDKPWLNSLGIKLVPLGKAMIASIETRCGDLAEFAKATNQPPVDGRALESDRMLPVTMVNRAEADQFCRWLTDRERALGLLEPDQEYRLPTDDEWSMAGDLSREAGASPQESNERIGGVYPWGFQWPPPSKAGNFLDLTADPSGKTSISGYTDGFATLAPVGSFRADIRGLQDLAGNVWEWVSTPWNNTPDAAVLRGGAYTTAQSNQLLSSHRRQVPASTRLPDAGFRVLLWNIGTPARMDE